MKITSFNDLGLVDGYYVSSCDIDGGCVIDGGRTIVSSIEAGLVTVCAAVTHDATKFRFEEFLRTMEDQLSLPREEVIAMVDEFLEERDRLAGKPS